MQLVGARFERHVDHTARGPAVFGVVAVGQDAHFADGIQRGSDHVGGLIDEVDVVDVVIDSVQQEVVFAGGTHAVGGKTAVLRVARARFSYQNAGRQARQISKHALAAHRQLVHFGGVQIGALRSVFGLQ